MVGEGSGREPSHWSAFVFWKYKRMPYFSVCSRSGWWGVLNAEGRVASIYYYQGRSRTSWCITALYRHLPGTGCSMNVEMETQVCTCLINDKDCICEGSCRYSTILMEKQGSGLPIPHKRGAEGSAKKDSTRRRPVLARDFCSNVKKSVLCCVREDADDFYLIQLLPSLVPSPAPWGDGSPLELYTSKVNQWRQKKIIGKTCRRNFMKGEKKNPAAG